MVELPPEVEAHLSSMSDADWHALGARLRAPDTREQLRTTAAEILGGDQDRAQAFASMARADAYTTDGQIDPAKVRASLVSFGLIAAAPQRNYGQGSGMAAGPSPGEAGKAEAARRYGTPHEPHPGTAAANSSRGAAGRAAAAQRFGNVAVGNGKRGKADGQALGIS